MNTWSLFSLQSWELMGWTMCYFLAAGTAVALAGALVRFSLRRTAPQVRYTCSLAVFALLALLPAGIGWWLVDSLPAKTQALVAPSALVHPPNVIDLKYASEFIAPGEPASAVEDPAIDLNYKVPRERTSNDEIPNDELPLVAYLPWIWLVGTPLTFVLLATGLVGTGRLRRQSSPQTAGPVFDACERMRTTLAISCRVAVAVHERITSPLLVGIVRPVILLPPAALTGWSPEELEMVLLHELAHVRRWDNLVNFLQRVVESLLFFHPCVWWVSRWVRRDREECVDAVVVAHTAKPQAYVELLVALASPASGTTRVASLALARHPLAGRIRRILKLEDEKMLVTRGTLGWCGVALVALLAVAAWQPSTQIVAEEGKSPVAEKKEITVEDAANRVVPNAEAATQNSPFLTLQQQRAADLAYKMLGLELEPLSEEELKKMKSNVFAEGQKINGGLRIKNQMQMYNISKDHLLVGLHVWPVASLQDVAEVLKRDDIAELSPLKAYLVFENFSGQDDEVISRRIPVNVDAIKKRSTEDQFVRTTSYMLSPGDSVKVIAIGAYPDQPIDDVYAIESTGTIALGPIYGRIKIAGLTPIEAEQKVQKQLETILKDVRVQITLYEESAAKRAQKIVSSTEQPANPLYDNKTFDQWRTEWQNELKTEKRTEAIKALAAFGRAGKGQEAAEAILDVAGEYEFYMIDNDPEGKLKEKVLEMLTGYQHKQTQQVLWPALLERYQEDPPKWQNLLGQALWRLEWPLSYEPLKAKLFEFARSSDSELRGNALSGLMNAPLDDAEVHELAEEMARSEDPEVARWGWILAVKFPSHGGGGAFGVSQVAEVRSMPALLATLSHPKELIRRESRRRLANLNDKDAKQVTDAMLKKLQTAKTDEERIIAIRALAAIGERAAPAAPVLRGLIESDSEAVQVAAGVALDFVREEDQRDAWNSILFDRMGMKDPTREQLEQMSEAQEEQLKEIGTQLKKPFEAEKEMLFPPQPKNGGGGGGFF